MPAYRPQLDALRALAVSAVLYCHFWSPTTELAELGVRLFFVLSGFLLTRILLNEASIARLGGLPQRRVLLDFYGRRTLRIWPAYYFALVSAAALGATAVRQTFPWHALFATNFLFFREQEWYPVMTAHLWTLSIEEQFYLALPVVLLFFSRKLLKPLLIGCIAAAVLFRGAVCALIGTHPFYAVLPIAQFDALGAGALLAAVQFDTRPIDWRRLFAWSLPAAILGDVVGRYTYGVVHFTVVAALYLLPMVALVAAADSGVPGLLGKILSSRALVGLGRISYGVYLYHLFVGAGIDSVVRSHGLIPLALGPTRFLVLFFLTVALAIASWILLERPALKLRGHFRHARGIGALIPAAPALADAAAGAPVSLLAGREYHTSNRSQAVP